MIGMNIYRYTHSVAASRRQTSLFADDFRLTRASGSFYRSIDLFGHLFRARDVWSTFVRCCFPLRLQHSDHTLAGLVTEVKGQRSHTAATIPRRRPGVATSLQQPPLARVFYMFGVCKTLLKLLSQVLVQSHLLTADNKQFKCLVLIVFGNTQSFS